MTKGPSAAQPPREVRIDECEREELRLAKQRKYMAVLRNADHPCQATGQATMSTTAHTTRTVHTAQCSHFLHMANCQNATPTNCNVMCQFKG